MLKNNIGEKMNIVLGPVDMLYALLVLGGIIMFIPFSVIS